MIRLENLTVRFGGLLALDAVSVEFTAPVSGIIGPNGAGKTTTMNVLSGFLDSKGGRVDVEGTDLLSLSAHARTRWGLRRSFQREQIAEDLSVRDNILAMTDHSRASRADKRADLERAIEFAGISDILAKPGAGLNTYERRLTDLARCVVGQPRLIMLDEPAGGLTRDEAAHLGDLILGINDLTSAKVLVIDHDVDLIERICTETLVLDFGKRIDFGPTRSILDNPAVRAAYLGFETGAAADA